MAEDGSNWCSILRQSKNEEWLPDLRAALGSLTGDIDDLRVSQIGGYLTAEFHHQFAPSIEQKSTDTGKWMSSSQESDGTLRMAGILTALLQEPPLTLIGIEEPELTIHPGALRLLYDFLEEASTRSQVVITTHSPDLLEHLNADEVRVVSRTDGVTTVSEIDETQRREVRDRLLTLGELMRIEGIRPRANSTAVAGGGDSANG